MENLSSDSNGISDADYSKYSQNTLEDECEHAFDPSWILSWNPLPDNGISADYELAGRSRDHSYHDLRSARRARHRLQYEKNKYYGYRSVNRGQLGAKHYQPNLNFCGTFHGYSTPLPEAKTTTMTKKTLYQQAQLHPRPPKHHRARRCDGAVPQIKQRMAERKHRSKDMRDDLKDVDDYWFQYHVHGSNLRDEDHTEWWWASLFSIAAESEILYDSEDVLMYQNCSDGNPVTSRPHIKDSDGFERDCTPQHNEILETSDAAPLSDISTNHDAVDYDVGWLHIESMENERDQICSADNPHSLSCDSDCEFEIVTQHDDEDDSDWTEMSMDC